MCSHDRRADECAKRVFGTESAERAGQTASECKLACGRTVSRDSSRCQPVGEELGKELTMKPSPKEMIRAVARPRPAILED